MEPILNFLPLLAWMMGCASLFLLRPPQTDESSLGVLGMWLLGTLIFLGVGIWITARA